MEFTNDMNVAMTEDAEGALCTYVGTRARVPLPGPKIRFVARGRVAARGARRRRSGAAKLIDDGLRLVRHEVSTQVRVPDAAPWRAVAADGPDRGAYRLPKTTAVARLGGAEALRREAAALRLFQEALAPIAPLDRHPALINGFASEAKRLAPDMPRAARARFCAFVKAPRVERFRDPVAASAPWSGPSTSPRVSRRVAATPRFAVSPRRCLATSRFAVSPRRGVATPRSRRAAGSRSRRAAVSPTPRFAVSPRRGVASPRFAISPRRAVATPRFAASPRRRLVAPRCRSRRGFAGQVPEARAWPPRPDEDFGERAVLRRRESVLGGVPRGPRGDARQSQDGRGRLNRLARVAEIVRDADGGVRGKGGRRRGRQEVPGLLRPPHEVRRPAGRRRDGGAGPGPRGAARFCLKVAATPRDARRGLSRRRGAARTGVAPSKATT